METFTDVIPDAAPVTVPSVASATMRADVETARLQRKVNQLAALTDLISRLEATEDASAACRMLADQLREYLPVDHVFVGLCRDDSPKCALAAISDVASFHPRNERAVAAQAVLQESIARGELGVWPAADVLLSGALLAHRQFATTYNMTTIVSGPLHDQNGVRRGAWMATVTGDAELDESALAFLRAAETPVGSALHLVLRTEKGRFQRMLLGLQGVFREKRGRAYLAFATVIALLLCIPLPYHARCDCTVEPVTRRFVAAPFAGPLEKVMVEPGDVVKQGDLLARMDGRELRWELAGLTADLHRASKELAGHLATHASGETEIARHEVERLRIRTQLLEHRDRNLEIRSPIPGVVVSGDLKDAEGMPLEIGESLFEIAPLDEMLVEVAIAEDDFAYVRPGMPVTIRLEAFPLRPIEATIERVHPRAELRDDENVFIAEVRLDNPGSGLRPGMRGTARVKADPYPLGWNLLRRPLTTAIAWLGW